MQIKTGFILEDNSDALEWMGARLREAFPRIDLITATHCQQAEALIAAMRFDIALIDLKLPDGSAIPIIVRLNAVAPPTLTCVVTIYDDDQHLFPALQAGAGGYLLKDTPAGEFTDRIRRIGDGDPPLSPAIARRVLKYFSNTRQRAHPDLTPREKEVLTLIAKGVKIAQVAEMLAISPHTTAGYVKEIYRKLNISSRAEASMEAAKLGLVHRTF